jgi:hypothetical protein
MNRDTVIAGIPTIQHCQDELVDQTLHDAALEHDLETIMEELTHHSGELSTEKEVVDSGGNVAVLGEAIVPNSGGNVAIPTTPPIPTSGEATHHPMASATVHFDAPPPPIRKDPLQPVEMLTKPPLVVRRSNRNMNKPSRFRAMFTKTAAMVILPIVPARCTFLATHDHMVPGSIPYRETTDWTYHQVPDTTHPVSRAQEEYVRLCDAGYDMVNDPADHREWTPLRMLDHRIRRDYRKRRYYALAHVTWLNDYPSWITIDALRQQQPFLIIDYVI